MSINNASKPIRKARTRARTRTRRPKFLRLSSWNSEAQSDGADLPDEAAPSAMEASVEEIPSHGGDGDLVKAEVRGADVSVEERWVSYGDFRKEEEFSISGGGALCGVDRRDIRRLALKLDYEEIMNSWSDKGSLYVVRDMELESAAAQIVPDIGGDELPWNHDAGNNVMVGWGLGSMEDMFRVPENDERMRNLRIGEEMEEEDDESRTKMEQREASVLRYKEKRRNRLFSKRIRYEVRKLNAEKRPRLKGRFVKRN